MRANMPHAMGTSALEKRSVLDIAAVMEDVRPLCLLHIPKIKEHLVRDCIQSTSLQIHHTRSLLKYPDLFSRENTLRSTPLPGRNDGEHWLELWLGKKENESLRVIDWEQSTGHFLGYPECCCRKYEGKASLAGYYQEYLFSLLPRAWEINRLASVFCDAMFLPDYFPCSLCCNYSKKLAQRFIDLSRQYLGEDNTNFWINDLMAPLTIWDDSLVWWQTWQSIEDTLVVDMTKAKSKRLFDIANIVRPASINRSLPWLIPFEHLSSVRRLKIVKGSTPILSVSLETA